MTLLLLALATVPSPLVSPPPPVTDWYVEACSVQCTVGDGTSNAPFHTIGEAIDAASSGDTVRIAAGTYCENLTIEMDLNFIGTAGQERTEIRGGCNAGTGFISSVFKVSGNHAVTIDGVTICDNQIQVGNGGGVCTSGPLSLRNSTISECSAVGFGGGLYAAGPTELLNCSVTNNSGNGGGIYAAGSMDLINCKVTNNHTTSSGGLSDPGIRATGAGPLRVINTTVSGNSGAGVGGIYSTVPLLLSGSTVSGNSGSFTPFGAQPGGVMVIGPVSVVIQNSTITGNGGAGLATSNSSASLENVTMVDNPGGWWHEPSGTLPEVRNSVLNGSLPAFIAMGPNLIGVDANLAPLAANGGPTMTRAPLPGSPVIDAGDPITFELVDQRGFARVGIADLGAHEFGAMGGVEINGCTGTPNSTGSIASMSAAGPFGVSENGLTLSASSLPPSTFGFFMTSQASGFTAQPGGSAGNLCLAGAIGRFVGPGQIREASANGSMSLGIDLDLHPTPTGSVPVNAGETWYFQTWYRDTTATGTTSNFSTGVQVTFGQ